MTEDEGVVFSFVFRPEWGPMTDEGRSLSVRRLSSWQRAEAETWDDPATW